MRHENETKQQHKTKQNKTKFQGGKPFGVSSGPWGVLRTRRIRCGIGHPPAGRIRRREGGWRSILVAVTLVSIKKGRRIFTQTALRTRSRFVKYNGSLDHSMSKWKTKKGISADFYFPRGSHGHRSIDDLIKRASGPQIFRSSEGKGISHIYQRKGRPPPLISPSGGRSRVQRHSPRLKAKVKIAGPPPKLWEI